MVNVNIPQLQERVAIGEKIGMTKINIVHETGNEGIWACFVTEQDKQVHDQNSGGQYEVYLMNHALIGFPSWGAKLKIDSTRDEYRETILAEDVIAQINKAIEAGEYPTREQFEQFKQE